MSDYQPRLRQKYQNEIVPQLMKDFGLRNVMQVPKMQRVVVNMGLGELQASREDAHRCHGDAARRADV